MADANSEMRFVDLPERTEDDLAIPVSNEEPTKNVSRSWAEQIENAESHMDQHDWFEYSAHLRSEIYPFDGSLGELSEADRACLYHLNGVPN